MFFASLDDISLFTSIPIQYACEIIDQKWSHHNSQSSLNSTNVIELIEFCLKSNCFIFKNKFYKQITGAVIRSLASVRIIEIVMQIIEHKIISTLNFKIFFWHSYIDDIFIIAKQEHLIEILNQTNSLNSAMQFTTEYEVNNSLPFLNVLLKRKEIGDLQEVSTTVYRKAIFTDQYINFNSIDPI